LVITCKCQKTLDYGIQTFSCDYRIGQKIDQPRITEPTINQTKWPLTTVLSRTLVLSSLSNTIIDGYHRAQDVQDSRAEPETSASRAARIRAFLENSSSSPYSPSCFLVANSSPRLNQLQVPLSAIPISLVVNALPSEGVNDDAHRGLPQSFLDTLDRVDKKALKKDDTCPICATPYLEDQYPLVVKLGCGHKFDLECIGIWFKEHSTCPMCRQSVEKQKPIPVPDDEEEYDDTYS
jgi:Ring finger domain